jgi:dsRNA-specific ribonuclease
MTKIYDNPGQVHQAERIEVTIRYQFNEKEYLWQVLKSGRALMQGKALDESGDRLLFLGEAVLQMIAADCCYEQPKAWIEFLEPKTLGQLADQLEVTDWIQIRVDYPERWGDERLIHLGQFLKLLTGMIYLDCNFYQVRDWFLGQVIGIDNPLIPPDYPGSAEPYRDFFHLGKSALNLIASDYLYARFPGVPKDVLCHIREGCKEKMLDLGKIDEKSLGKNYVKGKFVFVRNKLISLIQKAEK